MIRLSALAALGFLAASPAFAACPTASLSFKDAGGATQVLCFGGAAGAYIPQYSILDAAGANGLTVTAAGAAKVDGSAVTQPISGAISGTVTSNQGGTWTVQPGNTANTTAWKVDGSAVTQPVSGTLTANAGSGTFAVGGTVTANAGTGTFSVGGTVTANAGTNLNTSLLALEGGGNLAQLVTDSGPPGAVACATDTGSCNFNQLLQRLAQRLTTINTTLGTPFQAGGSLAANQSVNVAQVAGATAATAAAGILKVGVTDGAGNAINSTSNNLNVQCANCSGSGVSTGDEATFTAGTSLFAGGGGFFQTTPTNAPLTNGQQGMFQLTANRALFTNLRNASGAEVGVAAAPLQVSLANTAANATAVKVDGSTVTQPVSGTVTSNAGTGTRTVAGSVGISQTTDITTNGVEIAPTAAAAAGIAAGSSTAVEGSHVIKAGAGNLYDLYVTAGATAGFVMTFNATTAPADGAVTPVNCVQAAANQTTGLSFGSGPPEVYSTGISAVFSSTGCFTKTASATAFFKWRAK